MIYLVSVWVLITYTPKFNKNWIIFILIKKLNNNFDQPLTFMDMVRKLEASEPK